MSKPIHDEYFDALLALEVVKDTMHMDNMIISTFFVDMLPHILPKYGLNVQDFSKGLDIAVDVLDGLKHDLLSQEKSKIFNMLLKDGNEKDVYSYIEELIQEKLIISGFLKKKPQKKR